MCHNESGNSHCSEKTRLVLIILVFFSVPFLIIAPSFLIDLSFLNRDNESTYGICKESDVRKISHILRCFMVGLTEWLVVLSVLFVPVMVYFLIRESVLYYKYGVCLSFIPRGTGLSEMSSVIECSVNSFERSYTSIYIY